MIQAVVEPGMLSTPPDEPAYRPFPELAHAIRSQSARILDEWRARTISSMPDLGELSIKEFKDDIARILTAMADSLESNESPDLRKLVQAAPAHGFHRFMQDYDLADLFAEERVLRRVILARVEEALSRQCRPDEAAALHAMIDIMLQQGVLALVQQQKQELREAADVQLRCLSYLSHDLSNNFLVITSGLEFVEQELASLPALRESAAVLNASLRTIRRTREGMRQLLEHERLRTAGAMPQLGRVNLKETVDPIVTVAAIDAHVKRLTISVDIGPDTEARSNADLLTIILQNLIGNAVKHTARPAATGGGGTVRVEARRDQTADGDTWVVSVVDDGPGIPSEQLDCLFDAFQERPQRAGKAVARADGFGLGLAIAAQAARVLGTIIEVDTEPGQGCRFWFRVPALP